MNFNNQDKTFASKLLTAISTICHAGKSPALREEQFSGGQYDVYRIDFDDCSSWAIRLPKPEACGCQDIIAEIMKAEVSMIRELTESGFRWAPDYQGANFSFDNPVGRPFIALSWIDGDPLIWSDTLPERDIRNKVHEQLALIQVERIAKSLRMVTSGRESASDFFRRLLRNRRAGVLAGRMPGLTAIDCDNQDERLWKVLDKDMNFLSAIDHGDEGLRNILVDQEHNITGLIDYGFAQRTPLQLAAGFPRLLKTSSPNEVITTVIQEDRKVYIEALRSANQVSPEAVAHILRVQTAPDAAYRIWILDSARSRGVHKDLSQSEWQIAQ